MGIDRIVVEVVLARSFGSADALKREKTSLKTYPATVPQHAKA